MDVYAAVPLSSLGCLRAELNQAHVRRPRLAKTLMIPEVLNNVTYKDECCQEGRRDRGRAAPLQGRKALSSPDVAPSSQK